VQFFDFSKNRLARGFFFGKNQRIKEPAGSGKNSQNQRTGWFRVFQKAGSFLVFPGSLAFKVFSRSVPRAGVSENRNCSI